MWDPGYLSPEHVRLTTLLPGSCKSAQWLECNLLQVSERESDEFPPPTATMFQPHRGERLVSQVPLKHYFHCFALADSSGWNAFLPHPLLQSTSHFQALP